MRLRTTLYLLVFLVCVMQGIAGAQVVGRIPERVVRKAAVKIVVPDYPVSAVKNRVQGVAVAEIEFNVEGQPVRVEILESPAPEIADAVQRALWEWRFAPGSGVQGSQGNIVGKLTYYFVLRSRTPAVLGPDVPGYWGAWKQSRAH